MFAARKFAITTFMKRPGADEEERARGVDVARIARRRELRDELARAHDRARDEVREEREVCRELPEADRLEVAPVDVHDVADAHEREEGDADGKDDRARLEWDVDAAEREEVVRRRDEEVVVLEVAENAEVPDSAPARSHFRARSSRRLWSAIAKTWFHTIENASRKQKRQSHPA